MVPVLIAVAVFFYTRNKVEDKTEEFVLQKGSLHINILATGMVGPENKVEIKPPIPGRIEKVLVKEGQKVRQGQILAWMSSNERAALLDSVRTKGSEELKRWEELYRPTPIIAPIGGTVIQRNVETGQTFTISDPLIVLSDRLLIKAQVDETDLAQIKLEQPAAIILDAYPERPFLAKVLEIAYDSKTVNNVTTYEISVLPLEIPDFIRSGMTANVTFEIVKKDDILLIPNRALVVDKKQSVANIRDPSTGTTQTRPLKIGLTDGKLSEVLEGAKADDVAVVTIKGKPGEGQAGSNSPFSLMPRKKK